MKTVIIIPYSFASEKNLEARLLFRLAKRLADDAFGVTAIGVNILTTPEDREQQILADEIVEIDPKYNTEPRFRFRVASHALYRHLKLHHCDADIIISAASYGDIYYALIARELGLAFTHSRFVVTHIAPRAWLLDRDLQLPHSISDVELDFLQREITRLSDAVTTPTLSMKRWLHRHNWCMPSCKIAPLYGLYFDIIEAERKAKTATNTDKNRDEVALVGSALAVNSISIFFKSIEFMDQEYLMNIRKITLLLTETDKALKKRISEFSVKMSSKHIEVNVLVCTNLEHCASYLAHPQRIGVISLPARFASELIVFCLNLAAVFLVPITDGLSEMIDARDRPDHTFQMRPSALALQIGRATCRDVGPARPSDNVRYSFAKIREAIGGLSLDVSHRGRGPDVNEKPLVSVVIVHFERPALLDDALRSIYAQDYENIEVIIVDDGSRSSAAKTLLKALESEFAPRGWTVISQENGYPGAARNRGAKKARGKYLLFMDDDNVAESHEISTLVQAAEFSHADVLTVASQRFDEHATNPMDGGYKPALGGAIGVGLFSNAFGDTNALWLRRSFVRLGGFSEQYGVGHEDHEFAARAVLAGYRMLPVPEALFRYRTSVGGVNASSMQEATRAHAFRAYLAGTPQALGVVLGYALATHLDSSDAYHSNARTVILYLITTIKSRTSECIRYLKDLYNGAVDHVREK